MPPLTLLTPPVESLLKTHPRQMGDSAASTSFPQESRDTTEMEDNFKKYLSNTVLYLYISLVILQR